MHKDILIFLRLEKKQLEKTLLELQKDQESNRPIFENRLNSVLKAIDIYTTHLAEDCLESNSVVTRHIYALLQDHLDVEIKSAPDEWSHKYGVDFYIEITKEKLIGIHFQPVNKECLDRDNWKLSEFNNHAKFKNKYQGKVFIIYFQPLSFLKRIQNINILNDIREEMEHLQK